MKTELAQYILTLQSATHRTHRAEDRPIYEKYLADAAVLLAMVEMSSSSESIAEAIRNHDRLWGHTWLVDDAYKEPSSAWQAIKERSRESRI